MNYSSLLLTVWTKYVELLHSSVKWNKVEQSAYPEQKMDTDSGLNYV